MNLVIKHDHNASAATPLRAFHRSNRYAAFGLVGVLGVLAFLFSAVSPDDDDIQQDFVQGNRKAECVVQSRKSTPSIRGARVNPVHYALIPGSVSSICYPAIERVHLLNVKIGTAIFHHRTTARSPPTKNT